MFWLGHECLVSRAGANLVDAEQALKAWVVLQQVEQEALVVAKVLACLPKDHEKR